MPGCMYRCYLGGICEPLRKAGHGRCRRCKPLRIPQLLAYFLHRTLGVRGWGLWVLKVTHRLWRIGKTNLGGLCKKLFFLLKIASCSLYGQHLKRLFWFWRTFYTAPSVFYLCHNRGCAKSYVCYKIDSWSPYEKYSKAILWTFTEPLPAHN